MGQQAQYYDILIENEPMLTDCGFAKFELPLNRNATKMVLYNNKFKSMITYVDWDRHNSIDKGVKLLRDKLLDEQRIRDERVIETLCTYFRNACVLLSEDTDSIFFKNGNGRSKSNKSSNKKSKSAAGDGESKARASEYTVFKYSQGIPLAEEVTIANKNVFLQIIDDKPVISEKLDLSEQKNIILMPHEQGTGSPIFPYTFANLDEINYFIKQAQAETIDSLFLKHKSIWKKIVAADNKVIGLLAMDSVYSYFQDRFAATHYDMFVGAPESGKGAMLTGFKYLGYRVVVASDMSGANLLDLLTSIEANQITLAEDELDNIHEDADKLRIYKVGYDNTSVIPRTLDGNTSSRAARYYYPYCFKIYAAEQSPDTRKLEGFNDRIFKALTMKGKPKIYVKKLSEKTDDKRYNDVKSKIDYLRKLTLVYRLIHFADVIEQVNTNLEGRALELTEPQIRLFNSDKLASEDQAILNSEVLHVLSSCLRNRGELRKKTLEAIVYQTLKELLPKAEKKAILDITIANNENNNDDNKILSNHQIYDEVYKLADGSPIADKQYSFYSVEHGEVSEKKILKICRDKFFAKDDSVGRDSSKQRALQFNEDIVSKVGRSFDVVSEIKILPPEEDDGDGDDDDDGDVWNGWQNDGDDGSDDSPEQSTSHSGTKNEKDAVFEGNRVTKNTSQVSAQDSQNDTCSDHINSTGLCHTSLKDFDKNNGVNQNIIESETSAKTIDHISNGQSIDQEYTLLPEKQPNLFYSILSTITRERYLIL